MMNKTKLLALVLVIAMCFTMLASCQKPNNTTTKKEYTYNSYTSSMNQSRTSSYS